MKITDVKVHLRSADALKAFVNIVIENAFIVKNIKVIEGKSGLFVAMPSQKSRKGEYHDIAHPINTDTRNELERLILDKYRETLTDSNADQN